MKLFTQAKKRLEAVFCKDAQYLVPEQMKDTDFELVELAGKRIMTIKRARNPVQTIIYPAVEPQDKFKVAALTHLVNKIEDMYEMGYLDICPIRDSFRTFSLKSTPSTLAAMNQLSNVHCVRFNDLHPEVFEAIPRYLTHIFTEGRIPMDAVVVDGICETVAESEETTA
jgi:hypothetical protein